MLPSTKPDLSFDEQGVCAACQNYGDRPNIDWQARADEFVELVQRVNDGSPTKWDCIVPVSGGKDSTAQVLKVLEYGLNPLCVTSTTCDLSEVGRANIENIKNQGVDYIEYSPNKVARRKLNRIGLEEVGDIAWPEHVGIFTVPVRAAVAHRVPLILWGENSQNEYGGPALAAGGKVLDRRWLEEYGGLLGMRVSDLEGKLGLTARDFELYTYPTDQQLAEVGVTGLFLGHFFPWDGYSNALVAQANGFQSLGRTVEGSIVDYENLDNHQHGVHDYFKFLKFGFGRSADIASMHVRRGRLTRAQAIELVTRHDGKFPWSYLGKPLKDILDPLGLGIDEFTSICDRFTNKRLFRRDSTGELVRDGDGNLIKVNYDNT